MKKIWKVVFIVAVILCVAGAACIGVSYFMGGSIEALYENKTALPVLEMLSPEKLIADITAFFGF